MRKCFITAGCWLTPRSTPSSQICLLIVDSLPCLLDPHLDAPGAWHLRSQTEVGPGKPSAGTGPASSRLLRRIASVPSPSLSGDSVSPMSPRSSPPSRPHTPPAPLRPPLNQNSLFTGLRTRTPLAFHSHALTPPQGCHRLGSRGRRFWGEYQLTGALLGIDLKTNTCRGVTEAGLGRGTSWAVRQTPPRPQPPSQLGSWNEFSQLGQVEAWGLGSRPRYGQSVDAGWSQEGE